jgi:hypothetical protein
LVVAGLGHGNRYCGLLLVLDEESGGAGVLEEAGAGVVFFGRIGC